MRTTINLESEAYKLAHALATARGQSLGHVVSEAILKAFAAPPAPVVEVDEHGWPILRFGRVVTDEDVAAMLEEN